MGTSNTRFESIRALEVENRRIVIQKKIDNSKTIGARRKLGQYATPFLLAKEIVSFGISLFKDPTQIDFLEPALGTGVFWSVLRTLISPEFVKTAKAFEIDNNYGNAAKSLWGESIDIILEDFTKASAKESVNLLISNPPYVRHHHISQKDKSRMRQIIKESLDINISGLSGLYCYFILLAHRWLAPGAISGWLIPSEFMDVNYGHEIKKYLLNKVQLLRIHRYNPQTVMFEDALVSSSVIWFKKEITQADYEVEFSYGGTHNNPEIIKSIPKSVLLEEYKWTRFPEKGIRINSQNKKQIKDYFMIKRGIATGANKFFILTKEQINQHKLSMEYMTPILPSPRYLNTDHIIDNGSGIPELDKEYFLLNCLLNEKQIQEKYPCLWKYLNIGRESVSNRYLCNSRKIWYFQEKRKPAPILCTYMGRKTRDTGKPFHFILNETKAIASNSYLMLYPKEQVSKIIEKEPSLILKIWEHLNSITSDSMENEGRVYGGGLRKIEPKELGRVQCPDIEIILSKK